MTYVNPADDPVEQAKWQIFLSGIFLTIGGFILSGVSFIKYKDPDSFTRMWIFILGIGLLAFIAGIILLIYRFNYL